MLAEGVKEDEKTVIGCDDGYTGIEFVEVFERPERKGVLFRYLENCRRGKRGGEIGTDNQYSGLFIDGQR